MQQGAQQNNNTSSNNEQQNRNITLIGVDIIKKKIDLLLRTSEIKENLPHHIKTRINKLLGRQLDFSLLYYLLASYRLNFLDNDVVIEISEEIKSLNQSPDLSEEEASQIEVTHIPHLNLDGIESRIKTIRQERVEEARRQARLAASAKAAEDALADVGLGPFEQERGLSSRLWKWAKWVKEEYLFPIGGFFKRNIVPVLTFSGIVAGQFYLMITMDKARKNLATNLDLMDIFGKQWGNKQRAFDAWLAGDSSRQSTFLSQGKIIRYFLSQVLFTSNANNYLKYFHIFLILPSLISAGAVGHAMYRNQNKFEGNKKSMAYVQHCLNKAFRVTRLEEDNKVYSYYPAALCLMALWGFFTPASFIWLYQNSMPSNLTIDYGVNDPVSISLNSIESIKVGIGQVCNNVVPGAFSNIFYNPIKAFASLAQNKLDSTEMLDNAFDLTNALASWATLPMTISLGLVLAFLLYRSNIQRETGEREGNIEFTRPMEQLP